MDAIKINTLHGLIDQSLLQKLAEIELLALDVDGTLTNGSLYLDNEQNELKQFDCKDGLGIALLQNYGVKVAIITGKNTNILQKRAKQLNLSIIMQGISDKEEAMLELKKNFKNIKKYACMGDDLNDLPMFKCADVTACPQDACSYIKTQSNYVTNCFAGHGAVREFIDLILIAKKYMNTDGSLKDYDCFKVNRQ